MYITPDYVHEPLYVITTVFNPIRYKTRWKHYERFAAHVAASGGILVTVEAAFGERHHALADGADQFGIPLRQRAPTDPTQFSTTRSTTNEPHRYIQVRTSSELWLKENLINIGVSRLPADWKYVAWVDADVMFARPNWVGETIHQLQHYKLVQMFSDAHDVGPRYAALMRQRSFGMCYLKGYKMEEFDRALGPSYLRMYAARRPTEILWHPGYAWAARREAWDELGGLIDFAMMGAGDNHMAHALVGEVDRSYHRDVHPRYRDRLREWQFRAERHIRRNVGYVSGLLVHYWHGRKVDRRYWDRWKILVRNQFNPDADLKYDWQGCLQLTDRGDARSIRLRDEARAYFRARNEDSIDLEGIADDN